MSETWSFCSHYQGQISHTDVPPRVRLVSRLKNAPIEQEYQKEQTQLAMRLISGIPAQLVARLSTSEMLQ